MCGCQITPDFRNYAAAVPEPGAPGIGDTHVLGPFLRALAKLNNVQRNFRVFGPDETFANGLEALFAVTQRQWGMPRPWRTTNDSPPPDG